MWIYTAVNPWGDPLCKKGNVYKIKCWNTWWCVSVTHWNLFFGLSQHQPHVLSYVRAHQCAGLSVRFLSSGVTSSSVPLFPPPCVLRKGSRLFSLCLSSRKWSGPGGRAQCLDTEVAEPRLGLGAHCSLSGNYRELFLLLLLNSVWHCVSPQQRKVCVYVCVCVFPACSLQNVHGALQPKATEERKSQTPYFHRDCVPASIPLW